MKKKSKILVAIVTLVMILAANTVGVLALQSFTDVAEDHWANEYIEKMAEKKIITGDPDATFRPSDNVTKIEMMVMIFRTLKATDKLIGVDLNSLVDKYNILINQYNIPDWAKEAVAVALEKNIISRYDVADFFKDDGTLDKATRTEVSVFLGKALNLYLKEDLSNNIITFNFNDAEFIAEEAAPYVDLLIRQNIIKGDDKGNFNPDKPIIRAAAAKMLSVSYDVLAQIVTDDSVDESQGADEDLKTVEGEILLVMEDDKNIVVINSEGKKTLYEIEKDTKIIIQDIPSNIYYLKEGNNIKLYLDKDDKLVKVEVDSNVSSLEGEIHSVVNMNTYYLITVNDKNDSKRTFSTDDDSVILINDKKAEAYELNKGDKTTLTLDGTIIEKLTAESMTRVYNGILESNVVFNQKLTLKIRTYTQKVYELEIDDDVDVEKNNKNKNLTDLVEGDIVTVTTEYGKVVDIVATSVEVKSEDEGIITGIALGDDNKITIKNDDGETNTYVISPDADIEIDNDNSTVYDLKLDYKVELKIENDMVTDIEATKVEPNDSITGTISEVFDDFDAITVKVKVGSETKYVSVLAEDADIISTSGSKKSFSYLDEDDEVFIYGKENHKIFNFVADKIIVLKKN